jgi:O-methyltransferase
MSLIDGFMRIKRAKGRVEVAEFGVGRGGSAFLLYKLVSRYGGHLTLYDLFGRIPEPSAADGRSAEQRYRQILSSESKSYYGNLPNLRQLIEAELNRISPRQRYTIVEGKYEDTLQTNEQPPRPFDLAHIDCDWYDSIKTVSGYLEQRISAEAILQFDDWDDWEGCRKAVTELGYLTRPNVVRGGALVVRMSGS